jgi:hypothetical protein
LHYHQQLLAVQQLHQQLRRVPGQNLARCSKWQGPRAAAARHQLQLLLLGVQALLATAQLLLLLLCQH